MLLVAEAAAQASQPGWMRIAGLICIAAMVAVAAWLKRRPRAPRQLEIVESLSLGGHRSLVLAKLSGEVLLLGSSEGGISLLTSRPAAAPALAAGPSRAPTFEAMLAENVEQEELRRKLTAARRGGAR